MPFLVDGDNLLGSWPGRTRSDAERRALAVELSRWATAERRQLVVVFDGPEPAGLMFGAGAVFSGGGRSADDAILARLRAEAQPAGWTVVTSDRSLGDRCRALGAHRVRSDEFRKRLTRTPGAEKPERESEIDYWLEQFGGEKERP
jgi:predicted RNA-binding protein with PIN domain